MLPRFLDDLDSQFVSPSGSGFGLFSWSFCRCISQSNEYLQTVQNPVVAEHVSGSSSSSVSGNRSGDDGDTCCVSFLFQFEGQVLGSIVDTFCIVSYAEVWVAHLFKLMDLDALPEHCAGDGSLGSVCKNASNAGFLFLWGGHDRTQMDTVSYNAHTILLHPVIQAIGETEHKGKLELIQLWCVRASKNKTWGGFPKEI